MKKFEYYLEKGDVRKVSKDFALAKSLKIGAIERADYIFELKLKEKSATIIFENLYESLRELGDSILALEGFKSYSHLATLMYLKKYGFDESFINKFNNFRIKRNNSKYYGKKIIIEETEEIIKFYKENINKLLKVIEDILKNE